MDGDCSSCDFIVEAVVNEKGGSEPERRAREAWIKKSKVG